MNQPLLSALLDRGDTHVGLYRLVEGEPASIPGRLVVPAGSWRFTDAGAEAPHVTFKVAANIGQVDGYLLAVDSESDPFLVVAFDEPHLAESGDVINVQPSVGVLGA